jgi:sodium transport system permease protein
MQMSTVSDAHRRGRLNWRHVSILYRREMRAAFREKTIVINSILIPIFLYPFLLWAGFTMMTFILGQTEGSRSRIVVRSLPNAHPGLRRSLELNGQVELIESQASRADLEKRIKDRQLDALVEFLPSAPELLTNNFQASVTFDQSKERSVEARERIKTILDQYRADWLKREARARGVDSASWQGFTLSSRNLASGKEMGAFLLGLMLPVIFVVMVAMGCFYPAVDALAGERERNTWETLMSTAANRTSIVVAKYLYIASLGGLAGALNLLAVVLTFKPILAPLLSRTGHTIEGTLPLNVIPILAVAALLLAGFVAAGMMIFASFARTFKEGQAMITPFYMTILVPIVFLQVPGLTLSLPLAFVPVVNVTLMVREAVTGTFHWLPMAVAVLTSLIVITLCLKLATFILRFEDIMIGSYQGSFGKFLKQRVLKRVSP